MWCKRVLKLRFRSLGPQRKAATEQVEQTEKGGTGKWGFCMIFMSFMFLSVCLRALPPYASSPLCARAKPSHGGSFRVMSILQCGQGIFVPMACGGNSMCPWQKKQDIFRRSGLRRVTVARQCGQGIFWPRFRVANSIWTPQEGQDSFKSGLMD